MTVIMTEASTQFITPLSLELASGTKVYCSLFSDPLAHITLPAAADVMLIAPATANTIAKYAHGIADDLLSTCLLSFTGKVVVAPSMNWRMYENPAFRENLRKIADRGAVLVEPEEGPLACGEEGKGRLAGVGHIIEVVSATLTEKDLAGERIVVTAGPTREYLDPVRFLSNRSSGKMGHALARAARDRGAAVTLISGPSSLERPAGVVYLPVETAREMRDAVVAEVERGASVLIMAAAVADFSPEAPAETKIEKSEELLLHLRKTEDIISAVTSMERRPFVVGFAAETGDRVSRAVDKLEKKRMDMVVFNDVTGEGSGFDTDTNRVVIIDRNGRTDTGLMDKYAVAHAILDRLAEMSA